MRSPLSSVIPDARGAGYRAAELLEERMAGGRMLAEAHRIAPLGIHARQSTDVLAIDDPDVVAVVRLIRERACDGVTVAELVRQVPLSRRVLESRFLRAVGRTPHAEIVRVRIERVKRLLLETDLSIVAIAGMAGFEHPEYLGVAFKRETGLRPPAFRRRERRVGPPAT